MKMTDDYWFIIEPYVFLSVKNGMALLYNTLDGVTLESREEEVVRLLQEVLDENNCGVVLLTSERYNNKDITNFINKLREKYMGDVFDVALSKGKPVQILPYVNFSNKHEIYKKQNFSSYKNALDNLSEISIYVDAITDVVELISFLQSVPGNPTFNIIGDIEKVPNYSRLLCYFNQHNSPKNLLSSYKNIICLESIIVNNFSYQILVDFPLDIQLWNNSRKILLNQNFPIEYIFDVSTDEECLRVEEVVAKYKIEKYQLNPVFDGENICFFKKNVFLTKEDILSASLTIKDFFSHLAMNLYDFGKINIMPNGDAYANINHPVLGNINNDNIYEIVYKEINEGQSWFNIRNQPPCDSCIYQWFCPSPSKYELAINRPNLCHVEL